MADDVFLNFRMKRRDRERLERVAAVNHLSATVWARQQILRAIEMQEARTPAAVPFAGAEAGR